MVNPEFLSYSEETLFSHVKVYANEDHHRIHLIPVSHIGTKRYFQELISYVGNTKCLFEYLRINSDNIEHKIRNIDEYLERYESVCKDFWEENKKLLISFYKNFLNDDLKKLKKIVKKKVKKSNEKLKKIYLRKSLVQKYFMF